MTNLGKYELLEPLGSGAAADVYRARDTTLDREVAVKILKPGLVADANAFARFVQEARTAARLFHSNIAAVFEIGEADGRCFIAMRYIAGKSLDKLLKEDGPLPWEDVLHMAQQVGAALDYAHKEGFLHRDVKPSNIIRSLDGNYILTDFGLTRAMMSTGLTSHTGAVLGTPTYIAPEVWEGKESSPATDVYALACVFYEMLTGQTLFAGASPPVVMKRHFDPLVLPMQWPEGVPVGVEAVLRKGLAREPGERFASCGEFTAAMGKVKQDEIIQKEAEERAAQDAVEKNQRATEENAQRDAEEVKRREAEEKFQRVAAEKARQDAEEKSRREAAERQFDEELREPREIGEKTRREADKREPFRIGGGKITRRQFLILSGTAAAGAVVLCGGGMAAALSLLKEVEKATQIPVVDVATKIAPTLGTSTTPESFMKEVETATQIPAVDVATKIAPTLEPTKTSESFMKEVETATQIPVVDVATKIAPTLEPTATPEGPRRPTSWPVGDVPRNRTLVYSYGIPIVGVFNPFTGWYNHQTGCALLYEPCAFYAMQADKEILWLAESYKPSADAKEWTITFRKGIKWSDGTPFKASDAAWSMGKLKSVQGVKTAGSFSKELVSAEAVDDITLKVTLNTTDWRFFYKDLTFRYDLGDDDAILAPQQYAGVADADLVAFSVYDVAKGWPITTGPYGVGTSTDQLTNFDIRPSWWAADTGFVAKYPDVWRLTSIPYTNDTFGAQQLINKEVDHTLDLRPFVVASTLAQADHLTTWTGRKPPYGYMDWWPISVQFCTAKPPFDNPKVRWAVAYSIDQQKVVDIGWGGAGTVAMSPFPNYPKLAKYLDGIKDITDQYDVLEFNLDKSATLMGEAGFTKDSEGFWVDAYGNRPDADIYADARLFGDLAPIVAEQLHQAGFFCQHKSPPDVWAASVDGRASMFMYGHGGSMIDPYDTFKLYYNTPTAMGNQEWGNITRWQNDQFKVITDQMNNTAMDDPKMKDLFRRGMEIWYKELPDLPLVQWYHRIPVNTWYWDNWPDVTNPYMNTALWHLTMLIVVLGLKATRRT